MKFLVTDIEFDFNTDMPDYYSVSFDDMDEVDGEGYVMWNRWGIYKLVDRDEFSRLNFLTGGDWTVDKVS